MKTLSDEGQRIMDRIDAGIKPTYEEKKQLLQDAIDNMTRAGEILDDLEKKHTKFMRNRAFDKARI